jgi:uncharacterized phiE125 gp8 family phage protein
MVSAARRHIEQRCNRVVVRQKWRIYFDYQLTDFAVEPFPVHELEQIQYIDIDGATQTVSTSIYDLDVPRQCVRAAYGEVWPSARWQENAAWADVWAGEYTVSSPINTTAGIPEDMRAVMFMLVEDLYTNRGKQSDIKLNNNDTYDALLAPFVIYENR